MYVALEIATTLYSFGRRLLKSVRGGDDPTGVGPALGAGGAVVCACMVIAHNTETIANANNTMAAASDVAGQHVAAPTGAAPAASTKAAVSPYSGTSTGAP